MPSERNKKRVVLIVPARNEAATIAEVIRTAQEAALVDKICVVVNGSSDSTASIASRMGVDTVTLTDANKGRSMTHALSAYEDAYSVVAFLDADLKGLEGQQIDALIGPILADEVAMTCGILRGRFWRRAVHDSALLSRFPTLTGQRALRREVLEQLDDDDTHGYRIEAALNRCCKVSGLQVRRLPLNGVTHVRKEDKGPAVKGRLEKYLMILSVYLTYARLFARQFTVRGFGRART